MANLVEKAKPLGLPSTICTKLDETTATDFFTLLTKDYKALAQIVVASGPPHNVVPEEMLFLLEDVIKARREAATWFKTFFCRQFAESNFGHLRFIKELTEVFHILGSSREGRNQPSGKQRQAANAPRSSTGDTQRMENVFRHLKLFDTVDVLDETPAGDTAREATFEMPAPSVTPTSESRDSRELLDLSEMFCHIFCFFKEFNDIRMFVRSVWTKYREREYSLLTASIVTQKMMVLCSEKIDDFTKDTDELFSFEMVTRFFWIVLHSDVDRKLATAKCEVEANLFYFKTYNTLLSFKEKFGRGEKLDDNAYAGVLRDGTIRNRPHPGVGSVGEN